MFAALNFMLFYLARSGGGGSGGSSGGGGSIIALIGYFPSYYSGKLVKRLLPRRAELIVSATSATIISIVLLILGALIHGGFFFMILIVAGVWLGWQAAFFGTWDRIKTRSKQTTQVINQAAVLDSAWDKTSLIQQATATFMAYQRDWSSFNLANIQTYTTNQYAMHAALMLRALQEMHRSNSMSNIQINGSEIVAAYDSPDNSKDTFQIAFEATSDDNLIDTRPNQVIFTDKSSFIEYWTFVRNGSQWLLDRIDQSTANLLSLDKSVEQFAQTHGMYYSLDMGWLFLPNDGVLFKGGQFGKSDINNHAIGIHNQHLVQLYTYTPTSGYNILVGQINLPKSYGGILIRRKTGFFAKWKPPKAPSNYQKYTLEWPDFHTRYSVHATDRDRLATFELLNPGFMAYLYDTDPGVSIEVADNIVYLYKLIPVATKELSTMSATNYEVLFAILDKAFRELQL